MVRSEELKKLYTKFTTDFPIVSIEDPFDQDDWDHTAAFTAEGVCQVPFPPADLASFLEATARKKK